MRSLTTYRLAQEEFIRRGNLVKVLDPDGEWRPYQPNPDDLVNRRKLAAMHNSREAKTGTIGGLLRISVMTLLATIMIAFLIPVRRKSN